MPPTYPIDRSRITRYVTSNRVRCALSGAYSSKLNPRNLEVDYYPAYNHTLADLVDFPFEGALIVGQQYNLWLSKATFDLYKVPPDALESANYWFSDDEEDNSVVDLPDQQEDEDEGEGAGEDEDDAEDENEEDGIDLGGTPSPPMSSSPPHAPISGRPRRKRNPPPVDPQDFLTSPEARAALNPNQELTPEELIHAMKNLRIRARVADEPSDATAADTSMETIGTVPDHEGKDMFPDMLLCHSYAVDVDRPDNPKAVFGWERRARCKVRHQCFPLIMEIKGCPARSFRGKKFENNKAHLLQLAANQLYQYVQAYFTRDVCAECVIAMIASGPYWRWIQVKRREIGNNILELGDSPFLPRKAVKLKADFMSKLKRASLFLLGTEESDKELTRLRDEVLIPLIEDHHTYPSTMVPNLQR